MGLRIAGELRDDLDSTYTGAAGVEKNALELRVG